MVKQLCTAAMSESATSSGNTACSQITLGNTCSFLSLAALHWCIILSVLISLLFLLSCCVCNKLDLNSCLPEHIFDGCDVYRLQ